MARRALLVAVPATSYRAAVFPVLPGTVADADTVRGLLLQRAFGQRDILVPQGEALEAAAVQDALMRLAGATTDDDLAVVYFSGHGWQFPDESRDEADHLDECLVCADEPIGDDWFGQTFWPAARTGRYIVMVDACHSASAALGLRADDEPLLPPEPLAELGQRWRLSLAACRDEEVALSKSSEDGGTGVVTSMMAEILGRKPNLTHKQLWPAVATQVRDQFSARGAGVPQQRYSGPDESLLDARNFVTN